MSDVALAGAPARKFDFQSAEAQARVRRRYASERRFQAYGIAAIAFAGMFLVILVADIVAKGLSAFYVHSLTLPVSLSQEDLDPGKTGSRDEIAKADFFAVARNALRAEVPDASDRASRRLLDGLLSSSAGDVVRTRVLADPRVIGQTQALALPLSANADLHLKGAMTAIREVRGRGEAGASGTSGSITVFSAANDFSSELVRIKRALDAASRGIETELATATRNLGLLKSGDDRASLDAKIAELKARLDDYRARAAGTASEKLDSSLPTILVYINGGVVRATEISNDRVMGETILPLATAEPAKAGAWSIRFLETPETLRRVSDKEIVWLEALRAKGAIASGFNWDFFTTGDSREPELAGVLGGLAGSALTLLITLGICLPIGVLAAIYLEEFAPKNAFTALVEISINNLAAVPSIVFGLLGLAVFLNLFGMPRSSPLVGGLVLALLVLPTIIIASRAALKAVPPSIREAALGIGASHQQAVFHHVLPLAMPGIMTGTIIGMAHALGETAPLLMIGMVAFIVDIPQSVTQAATALPVQIFLWSDLPEMAFQAKTAAAIMVLLVFLFIMNGAAIWLRKRFERRW